MNKYIAPFVCVASTFTQILVPSQSVGSSKPDQVFYQDSETYVETTSHGAGTYNIFYNRLAPEGRWFYDDNYGYVFQPTIAVSEFWRPYSDGHWVWTDRGWTWVSNESFGWATYHYGRWIRVSGIGWVWTPGNEWAPAWVSWRQTDDDSYCGWAPLPPEATVSVRAGISSWYDNYYDIGPAAFTFVRFSDFWRPSYRGYYLPPEQNLTIINRTKNITYITHNNNVINNYGPQYRRVSQITSAQGHPLQTYQVNYAAQTQRNAAFKTAAQGNQLNVVAPPQKLNTVATMQPRVAKQLGKAQVQRGWQDIQPAQQQQLRQFFTKQAPVPLDPPAKLTAQKQKVEPQKPNTAAQVAKAQEVHIVPNNAVTRQHQLEQERIQHAHNAQAARQEQTQYQQVTHHATQHRAAPVQSAQPYQATVYHAPAQEHAHASQPPHPHSEHRPNDEQHYENSKGKKEKKNLHADQR